MDWAVLCAYFALMIGMGMWARTKIKNANDYFTAGGVMPWWLSGISHHMSGYSSAAFVAYAAIAYTAGFSVYIWWACTIGLAMLIGYRIFPPRWARLRQRTGMISPLEYLVVRYNLPTQQVLAWSGALLKIFDIGAKWAATAILLNVLAKVPPVYGVLLTGSVTLIYAVTGGLWANALTDFTQFGIQLIAGFAMLIEVLSHIGGVSALWTVWRRLPPSHSHLFVAPYTPLFAAVFLLINTLSYNGGTWNLAQRFIATPTGKEAQKAALLSASLFLVWPLVLFFPVWAAPLLLPHIADPAESYALMARIMLPRGLLGLVLGGLFASTMAMTSSDANAISAVVVRDILPALRRDHLPHERHRATVRRPHLHLRLPCAQYGYRHLCESFWRRARSAYSLVRCASRPDCDSYATRHADTVSPLRSCRRARRMERRRAHLHVHQVCLPCEDRPLRRRHGPSHQCGRSRHHCADSLPRGRTLHIQVEAGSQRSAAEYQSGFYSKRVAC